MQKIKELLNYQLSTINYQLFSNAKQLIVNSG